MNRSGNVDEVADFDARAFWSRKLAWDRNNRASDEVGISTPERFG